MMICTPKVTPLRSKIGLFRRFSGKLQTRPFCFWWPPKAVRFDAYSVEFMKSGTHLIFTSTRTFVLPVDLIFSTMFLFTLTTASHVFGHNDRAAVQFVLSDGTYVEFHISRFSCNALLETVTGPSAAFYQNSIRSQLKFLF